MMIISHVNVFCLRNNDKVEALFAQESKLSMEKTAKLVNGFTVFGIGISSNFSIFSLCGEKILGVIALCN